MIGDGDSDTAGDAQVARDRLVADGVLHSAFSSADVYARFEELCRQAQSQQHGENVDAGGDGGG